MLKVLAFKSILIAQTVNVKQNIAVPIYVETGKLMCMSYTNVSYKFKTAVSSKTHTVKTTCKYR